MKSILNLKRYVLAVVAVTVMAGFMAFLPSKINSTPKAEAAGLSTSAQNLAGLIAVDRITNGTTGTTGNDSLGNLLVLNNLFGTTSSAQNTKDLAGLIAVDRSVGMSGTTTSTSDNLGNLLVLNGLFGNGSGTASGVSTSAQNLAGLIAVDRITGGTGGTTGSDSLGNLIVLHNLFNN